MTEEQAISWIAEILDQPADQLRAETPRDEIPMWDSLGVLMLIAAYDEKFGIELADADMRQMRKVDDLLEILRREGKLQQPSPA